MIMIVTSWTTRKRYRDGRCRVRLSAADPLSWNGNGKSEIFQVCIIAGSEVLVIRSADSSVTSLTSFVTSGHEANMFDYVKKRTCMMKLYQKIQNIS